MVDSNIDNNNNNNNNNNNDNDTRIPENSVTELSSPNFNANNDNDVGEENEMIAKMFTGQNMIYLGIFIVVFWFTYISMRKSNSGSSIDTRMVDFIIFGLLIITMLFFYLKNRNVFFTEDFWKRKTTGFIEYLDEDYSFVNNVLILLGLYMVVYLLNVPMSVDNKPISITIIESIMIGLIIITGFVLFFRYILGVQLMDIITDIIRTLRGEEEQNKHKVGVEDKGGPNILIKQKEVFNIGDNKYTYKEAEAVCRVFDAEVASFDQVEKAYNDGGEWCNYGWTKGQMALFPTQKSTWKKLQKDPKHKNDCGRPGVNGGYFKNPYLKFGVNCYGVKQEHTETDMNRMKMKRISPHKRSNEDKELDKKVEEWKKNKENIVINSYNNTTWSKY